MSDRPLLLYVFICCFALCLCDECPVATTANGQVSGVEATINHEDGQNVCVYNAIPFAEPPVGELRFKPPKKRTTNWDGVRDGSVPKDACLIPSAIIEASALFNVSLPRRKNHTRTFSEDCLNLNVYSRNISSTVKKPVIVWIYGGSFNLGDNQQYDGSVMASLHDVVVVIPNYRVNIFGFLSLGQDSILPGNAGLFDPVMALTWIQENIENFGGDPTNVTLMGESAGAISIGYLINSDEAKGLFHRAVQFSGVASTNATLISDSQRNETNNVLLTTLGINDIDNDMLLSTLQQMDSNILSQAYAASWGQLAQVFPVVDGIFIQDHPVNTLETVSPVPTIIFTNDDEGFGLIASFVPGFYDGIPEAIAKPSFTEIIKPFLPDADFEEVYQKAVKHYLKQYANDTLFFSKLSAATFGDIYFQYPGFQTALKHSEKTDIYFGFGNYQLRALHDLSYGERMLIKPDWVNCDHADDLLLSLGMPFLNYELTGGPKFTDDEKKLSERMMAYVANFARNGDPNVGVEGLPNWPPFTSSTKKVLKFETSDVSVDETVYQTIMDFWTQDFVGNFSYKPLSNCNLMTILVVICSKWITELI